MIRDLRSGAVYVATDRTDPHGKGWVAVRRDGKTFEAYINTGEFEVLRRAETPIKVGDEITSAGQAARLPVGTLCVEIDEDGDQHPGDLPVLKIRDDRWVYAINAQAAVNGDDLFDDMRHRVLYLPEAA